MGATSIICERSEQKKKLEHCRIVAFCVLGNLPSKKIFPQFSIFLLSPNFFQKHLLPPVNEVDALPIGTSIYRFASVHCAFYCTSSSYGVLFQIVAVSTTWRQSARPEAFLHAEERPMFRGLRSASSERNQVWLGLPAGLLLYWVLLIIPVYLSSH